MSVSSRTARAGEQAVEPESEPRRMIYPEKTIQPIPLFFQAHTRQGKRITVGASQIISVQDDGDDRIYVELVGGHGFTISAETWQAWQPLLLIVPVGSAAEPS